MKLQLKILLVMLALIPCASNAQVKPRVAGLGDNAEYIGLLEREQELSKREDSLTIVITRLREEFRARPTDRESFAAGILQLENRIFEVRNESGKIAAKISEIESAFVMNNPQTAGGNGQQGQASAAADGDQSATLVRNAVFRRILPPDDYRALVAAQELERPVANILLKYLENYDAVATLRPEYEAATDAASADSIYVLYLAHHDACTAAADSLGSVWHEVYDNKLFAYNYMLQTHNQPRVLARLEAADRDARDELARQLRDASSEDVATYFTQKSLIFNYETTLAELFGLTVAADSLKKAAGVFELLKRPLPDVSLEERLFIEYANISVHNPAKYNTGNPVPELTVYQRGLIYRIMLGSYTVKQAVSIFKGVYPLACAQEGGKWNYYAGGFSDLAGAKTATEDLKKRGFRNPRIVVWNNGEKTVLDDKPATGGAACRVEISGARESLSAEVRAAINRADSGADISRAGALFIVGPFPTALEAAEVAEAVRKADGSLSVRIVSN